MAEGWEDWPGANGLALKVFVGVLKVDDVVDVLSPKLLISVVEVADGFGCGNCGGPEPKGDEEGVSGLGPKGTNGAFGIAKGGGFDFPSAAAGGFCAGTGGKGFAVVASNNNGSTVVVCDEPPPNHLLKKPGFLVVGSSAGAGVISISVL